MPLRIILTAVGVSVLVSGWLVIDALPATAFPVPVPATVSLEIAGPGGVFVPVASGSQIAVSSTTPTTARWTVTNTTSSSYSGFYLFTYGPDCLLSEQTIAAHGTLVCTEVISPEAAEQTPVYGLASLGALAGLYDGTSDYPAPFPITVNIVDDTNGTSFTLSETTVSPNETITITGSGFHEDDVLTGVLTSPPMSLGAFTVTGSTFSHSMTLPSTLAPGVHTITLYSNGVAYGARTFTLLGDSTAPDPDDNGAPAATETLPATGIDPANALIGGTMLLGFGLILLAARRRAAPSPVRIRSLNGS